MSFKFTVGTYELHKEPNFNYQMNCWMAFGNIPLEEIRQAAGQIRNQADWDREFTKMAMKATGERDVLKEAVCHRAVDFFRRYSHPEKESNYDRLVSLFRKAYEPYFREGRILEQRVDYENASLPVWYAPPRKGVASKGTVLMTGGFDCFH